MNAVIHYPLTLNLLKKYIFRKFEQLLHDLDPLHNEMPQMKSHWNRNTSKYIYELTTFENEIKRNWPWHSLTVSDVSFN